MPRPTALIALLALLLPALAPRAAAGAESLPDVVVVVWNDADRARLGFLGAEPSATPRLDALLADGVVFPEGLHAGPRGRAGMAALLSGRMPQQNGIYYQLGPKRLERPGTLGARLAARGYAGVYAGDFREGRAAEFGFERVLAAPDDLAAAVAATPRERPLFVLFAPDLAPGTGAPELDRALGELLDALAARGTAESALFAFLTLGEPAGREFSARECALERMRCPVGLVWRGRVPAGRSAARATPLDVLPTVLDALGLDAPDGLAGRSLLPRVAAAAPEERAHGAAFFAQQTSQGSKGGRELGRDLQALVLVEGSWKYGLYLEDVGVRLDPVTELVEIERSAGDQELFDLAADPLEQRNLFASDEHAERVDAMRARALEWWRASGGPEVTLPYLPPRLGPPPSEPRPNIVLVIADDMDYEHLGFLGNPRVRTPTIDALAREGLVFPVGHVPMSRCRPSLAALLSGRWPHQTGITENEAAHTLTRRDSLPNLLKAAGYATFGGGKLWEGSHFSMGFIAPERVDAIFKTFVRESQEDLFAFVDEHAGKRPLFLWWAPMLPHGPFDPPERFAKLFADVEVPVPPGLVGDPREYQERERTFYAMGAWLDEGLAALRAKLAEKGELEDTLFVFLNDNGYVNGAPSKGSVFEKGLRTPVFFSWPKAIPGGRTSDALVCSVDLYATILDYAGVPIPADAAGADLRPLIEGRADARPPRDTIHGAVYRHRDRGTSKPEKDVYALYARSERWKFVLYLRDVRPEGYLIYHEFAPFPERERGDRDLFDLAADPYERRDLAGDPAHAALLEELQAGCLEWWRATGGGELDLP